MMKRLLLAVLFVALSGCIAASRTTTVLPPEPPVIVMQMPVTLPPGVQWGPGPASLPAGARAAVLDGDPTREGIFTLRLWLPNDYRIPPHSHPAYEHITVISGVFHVGMGNTFSMAGPVDELRTGAFKVIAPNMNHFAHAAGEVVLQLHGMGPWRLTYVNPADDPRNQ